jgi:hypothetical protein
VLHYKLGTQSIQYFFTYTTVTNSCNQTHVNQFHISQEYTRRRTVIQIGIMKLVINILLLSQYPIMSSNRSKKQATVPQNTPENGDAPGEEPQKSAGLQDIQKRTRLPSFTTPPPTSKDFINVYKNAETSTNTVFQIDTKPAKNIDISKAKQVAMKSIIKYLRTYYHGAEEWRFGRISSKCSEVQVILDSEWFKVSRLHVATSAETYSSFVSYRSNNKASWNSTVTLLKSAELAISYYSPIAKIEIPDHLQNNKTIFRRGAVSLNIHKKNMAAFLIYTCAKGWHFKYQDSLTLQSFQDSDPPFYYCYICPLVQTMVVLMDNNKGKANLDFDTIMKVRFMNFQKRLALTVGKNGVWSAEQLECIQQEEIVEEQSIGLGVHYFVVYIIAMLSPTRFTFITNGEDKWYLTEEQKTTLRDQQNMSSDVCFRAGYGR